MLELLLILYIFIPQGILFFFGSPILLYGFRIIIILCFLFIKQVKTKYLFNIYFILFITLLSSFLTRDFLIMSNLMKTIEKTSILILVCIVPFIMIKEVKNFEKLEIFAYRYSIIVIIFNLILMFTGHYELSEYMEFGTKVTLPLLFVINRLIEKKNIFALILSVTTIISVLIFANRSSFLIIAIFIIVKYIISVNSKVKIFFFIVSIVAIMTNLTNIFGFLIHELEIKTYSVQRFYNMVESEGKDSSAARKEIYAEASEMIAKSPLMGHGLTYYERTNVGKYPYPHNILLQIGIEFGVIAILLLIAIYMYGFYKFIRSNDLFYRQIFLILAMANFRLFLSGDYMLEYAPWLLIGLSIKFRGIKKEKVKMYRLVGK